MSVSLSRQPSGKSVDIAPERTDSERLLTPFSPEKQLN